jgi:hypothetical protein
LLVGRLLHDDLPQVRRCFSQLSRIGQQRAEAQQRERVTLTLGEDLAADRLGTLQFALPAERLGKFERLLDGEPRPACVARHG